VWPGFYFPEKEESEWIVGNAAMRPGVKKIVEGSTPKMLRCQVYLYSALTSCPPEPKAQVQREMKVDKRIS